MIPIENIYYLFCYAWNRFEEAQAIPLGVDQSPDLPNLLGRVLLRSANLLMRRGLDRDYQDLTDELATVRGRILLDGSLRMQARSLRKLECEFDELNPDLLHNQIIKASLRRLARAKTIDPLLSLNLLRAARLMPDVSDIRLERSAFARVQLNRNNAYYDLVLKIAELAFDCLLPTADGSGFAFHDILRDEKKMAGVFQNFVRNFFRAEQTQFAVLPLSIRWDANMVVATGGGRLPNMVTDIYLKGAERRMIIDTKFYASALQRNKYGGSDSFQSGNFYQIFAYLKNAAADPGFLGCEGMLLYPRNGISLRETYRLQGHLITVATIDLAQPWPAIADELLGLLALQAG